MRIAIDAMGGDHAPEQIVEGAVLAARDLPEVELVLVGDEARVNALLDQQNARLPNLSVHHASQTVSMDETVKVALRRLRDSSINRAVELVQAGEASAVISAGNTAVAVAWSTLRFRTLPGVQRSGIAVPLPTLTGYCTVIDAGANVNCKPEHLCHYGIMGSALREKLLGEESPRVAVLNIGEEDAKGNELVKETSRLLEQSPINFVGNIEGNQIFEGVCDVVVCEGFVGNNILKTAEGLADTLFHAIKHEACQSWRSKLGLLLMKPALLNIKARTDFDEYGGAPLMGLNHVTIICHGRSNPKAIRNAVDKAIQVVEEDLNGYILEKLEASGVAAPSEA